MRKDRGNSVQKWCNPPQREAWQQDAAGIDAKIYGDFTGIMPRFLQCEEFRTQSFPLTILSDFGNYQNMKRIKPLPLARLKANEAHVEALKALAHLTRLQVVFFLVRAGREASAGEIQEAVGVPAPTLSHHLDLLRRVGLIQRRKEQRYVYYSVRREMASELARLLTACC